MSLAVPNGLDSAGVGARGLLLADVRQTGAVVEFRVAISAAGGTYKGTLNAPATEIAGEWTERAGTARIPLTFKKK